LVYHQGLAKPKAFGASTCEGAIAKAKTHWPKIGEVEIQAPDVGFG